VVASEKKAKISFKAFSPFGTSTGNTINGSDVSLSNTKEGPFIPSGTDSLERLGLQIGMFVPLVNVSVVRDGQLVFIQLEDINRNINTGKIDTVIVSINTIRAGLTAQNIANPTILDPNFVNLDNSKVIRLYETNPNSGVFMGYIIFRAESSNSQAAEIVVNSEALIAVNYQENNTGITEQDFLNFDAQISVEGRVFNALTGRLLNGMNISLIDAVNSVPAQVFASNGKTQFPSYFVTGTDTADSSGTVINVDEGEYVFPYVKAGQYRLRISNLSSSYIFPSSTNQSDILNLPNIETPIIENGSYGEIFTITQPRSVGIDLPIDTLANITVEKVSDRTSVSPGDMIGYTLTVTNHDRSTLSNLVLIDDAPLEMRYLQGSLTINGAVSNAVTINPETGRMTVALPAMTKGEALIVRYGMRLLPRIKNGITLRNSAQVIGNGGFVSNVSYSDVRIIDDLLQAKATIVGRVYFDNCNGNTNDANGNPDIIGLGNIRLYNQQGDYVLTDNKGRFTFSGIETGTNVIQLDKITLPKGVEMSFCKNNTRHAGTDFSQFVDTLGGHIYKVNFTLKGDKEKYRPVKKADAAQIILSELSQKERNALLSRRAETSMAYRYNSVWLETQNSDFKLIYPSDTDHPGGQSMSFGFKYPAGMTTKVYLNDKPVSQLHLLAVDGNKTDTVRLSHYNGVDLESDINTLRIELYNEDGKFLDKIVHQIAYNQEIYKVIPLKEKNKLIANGITPSNITFKLTDKNNVDIGKGQTVNVEISEPYRLYQGAQLNENTALNNITAGELSNRIPVSANGELEVRLQPTLESGRITVKVFLNDKDFEEYDFWVSPDKREWILVGLAQGSLGYKSIEGNLNNATQEKIDEDLSTDGKVQFYTKGTINKEWLITAAFDSEKRQLNSREELFGQIELNERFPIVGDSSQQGLDASSQYPLYLKIEKDQFYALFGDYNTDLGQSRLLPYSRTLSGFKTAYQHDNFSVQFFAAEDGQTFVRDDIPIIGIGEIYKLSGINFVRGSDRAYIELRDSNDASKLISTKPISRYIDYNIDYQNGTLTFTPSFFIDYNPANTVPFLVVESETFGDTQENMTYGGRVSASFFEGDIKTGLNLIRDGGGIRTGGRGTNGGSFDVDIKLTENSRLYAEYALTRGEARTVVGDFGLLGNDLGSNDVQGTGQLLEYTHRGDNLFARAYYRSEDNTLGIGTASSFNVARKSYGFEAIYDFSQDKGNKKTEETSDFLHELKNGLSFYAKMNQDRDTSGRGAITTTEVGFKKENGLYSAYSGLRFIKEDVAFNYDTNGLRQSFQSNSHLSQIISGGEYEILDNRLSIFGGNELPINDSQNTQSIYGNKNFLGFNGTPIKYTNMTISHEWVDLNGEEYQNSSASVVITPMTDLSLSVNGANHMLPGDQLTSVTSAVNKIFKISKTTDMNLSFTHREALGGREGIFSTINSIPDYYLPFFMRDSSVRSPNSFNTTGYWEDYNIAGFGLLQRGNNWQHNFAAEYKSAETENRLSFNSSVIGELTESLTVGIRGNYQHSRFKNGITINDFKDQLAQNSRNLGLDITQYADENTLNFLKDSTVARITGGTAYRPDGEDGPIILHRTLVEHNGNVSSDQRLKLVNNVALQANITDKLETNSQYAFKVVKDRFQGVEYDDFINVVGSQMRYDITENIDILTQGSIYHSADTKTYDYSYGLAFGFVPTKNVRLRIGYNIDGFNDNDFSALGYTAQGPYVAFDFKLDQENVKERLEQFMSGFSS
jgi:uncharacterized repeat protein (TIGR01451 family)